MLDKSVYPKNKIQIYIGQITPTIQEFTYANILVDSQRFTDRINTIRKQIGINKLLQKNTEQINDKEVKDMLLSLDDRAYEQLFDSTHAVVMDYGLSDAWFRPFVIAVLTNILEIPLDLPIKLIKPVLKEDSYLERKLNLYIEANSNNLLISVSRYVTPTELAYFINNSLNGYTKAAKRLPSLPKIRTSESTMFWGHVAYLYKTLFPDYSWGQIFSRIEKDEEGLFDLEKLPERPNSDNDLRHACESYLRTLDKLTKSK